MIPILGQSPKTTNPAPKGGAHDDVTTATFEAMVLRESMTRPVLVDLWAPWCGPCKQLAPILEKLVAATKGAIKLTKINIDENQEIAAALRVQSIPAVFAFYQGRPIDGFVGALPESDIKKFMDRVLVAAGGAAAAALEDIALSLKEAEAQLNAGATDEAAALYSEIIGHDENCAAAYAGLVRALIAGRNLLAASEVANQIPATLGKDKMIVDALSALQFASSMAEKSGDAEKLKQQLAENPKDHAAAIALAEILFGQGAHEDATEILLSSIRMDRAWDEGLARGTLIKMLDTLGFTHPLSVATRRKLSAILFQ